jgi:hypothetical protein
LAKPVQEEHLLAAVRKSLGPLASETKRGSVEGSVNS